MSIINCSVTVNKKEDPAGDRVLLTFEYVFRLSFDSIANEDTDGHLHFHQREVASVFDLVDGSTTGVK